MLICSRTTRSSILMVIWITSNWRTKNARSSTTRNIPTTGILMKRKMMVDRDNMVAFRPETRDALRVAYNQAVKDGKELFVFQGDEYLVAYAKYLLEFLDNEFAKIERRLH